MRLLVCFCGIALLAMACSPDSKQKQSPTEVDSTKITYHEKYRPVFHFSPAKNWTNDPNGLVYANGEYHVFYQYNPFANVWGHMSWGHAVSPDLLHWKHLPVAITEYVDQAGDSTMIFSGSAVVDRNNTSGFFPNDSTGLVVIYTSHVHRGDDQITQHQSIAYSNDKGRTFKRYEGNPVLDIKRKDFRDPKVFWYEPEKKWIMTAVIPDKFKAHFYESKDLKSWKFLSEFGPLGDTAKIWECPDLCQVPIAGEAGKKKWVLLISNSHPQGPTFVGMQYFVGNFDGKKFTPENPKQYPLYLDYGKDFYAAVTYNNIPESDGRTILLGWANNWAYGQQIPTSPWRSAMTLPRVLEVRKTSSGYRIFQQPIQELKTLRADSITDLSQLKDKQAFELHYSFNGGNAKQFGVKIFKSEKEETEIGYDVERKEVFIDRSKSGNVSFHPDFVSVERVHIRLVQGKLDLDIYVDHSIIEVFINGGEQVITDQVFPTDSIHQVETFATGGEAKVETRAWLLKSAWE